MSETPIPRSGPPQVSDDDTGRLDGASKARVFGILAIIVLFSEVVPLQYAMISAAIPHFQAAFPSAAESITWMIAILGLVGGATAPLVGKLSDIYGKKKMLLACSGAFLIGSIVCATTSSWGVFLFGRGLQATAFGMTAIVYGMIRDLMPRRFVPVAIGVSATGLGLSAALAPVLGGVLLDHYSWRSLFWFLTIFMAVSIPLLVFFVPESKLRVRQKLDLPGAILLGAGLAMVLLYISMGEKWGWGKPTAFGWAVVGVVVIALWYVWEKKAGVPLIDVKLLTAPKVAAVLGIALLANMIIGGQNLLTAYLAQTPKGDDLKNQVVSGAAAAQGVPPEQIPAVLPQMQGLFTWNDSMSYALGFSLLAMALHLALWQSLTSMVAGPMTGALGKKAGLRLPMVIGMSILSVSMIMYVYLHNSWQALLICGIVYGAGFGMYYAAAPNLMIEAVPQEQQGVASGMLVVAQSFGSSIAVALMSPLMTANRFQFTVLNPQTGTKTTMDAGNEVQGYSYTSDLFVQGFWMLAICGVVGLLVAVFMKHGRARATGGLGHLESAQGTGTAREAVGA